MYLTRPPGSDVAPPGKRVRFDGPLTIPPSYSTVHTGNVANPTVPLQFLVPPIAGKPWTHEIALGAATFSCRSGESKDGSVDFKTPFVYADDTKFTTVLDVLHTNTSIAEWYVHTVNKKFADWKKANPGVAPGHRLTLSQLYPPRDVLRDIANRWRMAGICQTEPHPTPNAAQLHSERLIGTLIRGEDIMRNYWDCGMKPNDFAYFALKFIETQENIITFGLDRNGCYVAGEFDIPLRIKYIPQFVAIHNPARALPNSSLEYEMDGKTYIGREYVVGICTRNPQMEYSEKQKDVPIIHRGAQVIDPEIAPTMNLLIHSN